MKVTEKIAMSDPEYDVKQWEFVSREIDEKLKLFDQQTDDGKVKTMRHIRQFCTSDIAL
jgi:hypothetical protein